MSQEQKRLIISVHEAADSRDITSNTDEQTAGDRPNLQNLKGNEENFALLDFITTSTDEGKPSSQATIANISAG